MTWESEYIIRQQYLCLYRIHKMFHSIFPKLITRTSSLPLSTASSSLLLSSSDPSSLVECRIPTTPKLLAPCIGAPASAAGFVAAGSPEDQTTHRALPNPSDLDALQCMNNQTEAKLKVSFFVRVGAHSSDLGGRHHGHPERCMLFSRLACALNELPSRHSARQGLIHCT
jgi:hypothetical protein